MPFRRSNALHSVKAISTLSTSFCRINDSGPNAKDNGPVTLDESWRLDQLKRFILIMTFRFSIVTRIELRHFSSVLLTFSNQSKEIERLLFSGSNLELQFVTILQFKLYNKCDNG